MATHGHVISERNVLFRWYFGGLAYIFLRKFSDGITEE